MPDLCRHGLSGGKLFPTQQCLPAQTGGPMSEKVLYHGYFDYVRVTTLGRNREILRMTDSVSLLVYLQDRQAVVLVRQPREAMIRPDNPEGLIVETIGGRFDAVYGVRELAAKEALEETGLAIQPESIEVLNHGQPMALSAGGVTERAYLCLAIVNADAIVANDERFSAAGEDERIERIIIPIDQVDHIVWEDTRVFALIDELRRRLDARKGAPRAIVSR